MTVRYRGATSETEELVHRHAVLRRGLEQRVAALCAAADAGAGHEQAKAALQEYLDGEIFPHAAAEERTLYQAAASRARGSQLARTLTAEHHDLAGLASRLESAPDPAAAAAIAEWTATLFAGHVAKENDLLLPALVSSGADLAALLADLRHATGVART